MWWKKHAWSKNPNSADAAERLIAMDKHEPTMQQLASLMSGETHPRNFYYAIIQVDDRNVNTFGSVCATLSELAGKNGIVHGSSFLSFTVFYAGLVDPVYTSPEMNIRSFVEEVLSKLRPAVRIVYGSCRGVVSNVGLFGTLVPAGLPPKPLELMAILSSIEYGNSQFMAV